MLSSELRGASFGAEAVTLSRGSIVPVDEVRQIPAKVRPDGIFDLLSRSTSEQDKALAINTLRAATQLPSQSSYSNDLCALVLTDTLRIAEDLTRRISDLPYQLRAHVENYLLFDYQRARDIAEAEQDMLGCRQLARDLMPVLRSFHEVADNDDLFVRYKTLVGFSSVFEQQWDLDTTDYLQIDQYRKAKIVEYVASISSESEEEWFSLIELCAATKSTDLATFPIFAEFIVVLAKDRPETACKLLGRGLADLLMFLPAFLGGLLQSGAHEAYKAVITEQLAAGTYLAGLARHWRLAQPEQPPFISAVLEKATATADDIAVIECVAAAVASCGTSNQPSLETFFTPAMRYLTERANYRWIREVWYLPQAKVFYSGLSSDAAQIVLDSLLLAPKIGHEIERVLACIADRHADLIWDFLARRLHAAQERGQDPTTTPFHMSSAISESHFRKTPSLP